MASANQADGRKRRVIETAYCILAGFCYGALYQMLPAMLIKDSYGLSKGLGKPEVFTDFWQMVSTGYIHLVNGLYFYLGEKPQVLTGLHAVCCFVSFLFLFFAVREFYIPYITYGIPAIYVCVCMVLGLRLDYDAWILIALGASLLFYLIVHILLMLFQLSFDPQAPVMTESLTEREKRERQAPKTIINAKGETVTLLANPLPGPKKHIKRTLDYDYEVPEGQMFYEIEDSGFDDYDV